MKTSTISSALLDLNDRRLDSGPYLSGAFEAKLAIQKLSAPKVPLQEVTKGYNGGIYNGPQFIRNYLKDPQYGVPFVTSGSMLLADLSAIDLLKRKDAESNRLSYLRLEEGMTLISCSGTIGRMAYTRPDMEGVWSSQDVLKVVPDPEKIPAGYLYAYLSSKFGVPQVVSGTYGAIIQHIEPHHIANLPVPRLGKVEQQAHELVTEAARLRAEANRLLQTQKERLETEIAGGPIKWQYRKEHAFATGKTDGVSVGFRLDAFHYVGYVGEALTKARKPLIELSEVADVFRPNIMKRIWVEQGGYEFLGGIELYSLDQRAKERISPKTPDIEQFIVKPHEVLFQCSGQRYGIFGQPVLANRLLIGKAVTEHAMRIISFDPQDAGYLSVYLATEFGKRLLMRFSSGSSIPGLAEPGARRIQLYWPDKTARHVIRGYPKNRSVMMAQANCTKAS